MALHSISLCAGIGGIDVGLESIGAARSVCYVEREAFAAACLVRQMQQGNLAEAAIWSDLRTFDARAWRGSVDLVVGGYPCQPFSFAGRRKGADDPRHLWPEVLRIYRESGARYLFCENVAGHLSLGFADVLADLAEVGATVEWGVFRASDVGAPHRRERLFFLADAGREYVRGRGHAGELPRAPGEGEGEGLQRERHGHAAIDGGSDVADADQRGRAPVLDSPSGAEAHRRGQGDAVEGRDPLADTSNIGHERAERTRHGRTRSCHDDKPLEHADGAGCGEHRGTIAIQAELSPIERASGFPPGPDDSAGWERWVSRGGPQPSIRRIPNGVPNRMDRLRGLGNAVVPQVAALAFTNLWTRMHAHHV